LTNEYALNYRASQNKRLQVELALLKLAYLQSALNVEKMVGQAPPVPIPQKKNPVDKPIQVQEPKLSLQPKPPSPVIPLVEPAKVVEMPVKQEKETPKVIEEKQVEKPKQTGSALERLKNLKKKKKVEDGVTLDSLDKLGEQEAEKAAAFKDRQTLLEYGMGDAEIQKHWLAFKDSLTSSRLKGAFAAVLPVMKEGCIYAKANSRIEQTTIQGECRDFVKKLSDDLNLKDIEIEIDVDLEKSAEIAKQVLTIEDKLNELIEQNPAIDEFRKRLLLVLKY